MPNSSTRWNQWREVYQRPAHPDFPVLCIDEMMKQLVKETVEPIPASNGQPERHETTYERNGTGNLFMTVIPKPLRSPWYRTI